MITEYDLKQAIAECQGVRNPNANTCIKLAAYLTIQKELYGLPEQDNGYSFDAGIDNSIYVSGDSEFLHTINGKDPNKVWSIMDEMMGVLQAVNPKLYASVMRKLREVN